MCNFATLPFRKAYRHRLTTRHGQDMRVFRRFMNVHCARQIADTILSENGAALAAKWEILPQDSRVSKLSGKYMFKTARYARVSEILNNTTATVLNIIGNIIVVQIIITIIHHHT